MTNREEPEEGRAATTEEEIAAARGARHELLMRLYRLLDRAAEGDSSEDRRRAMFAMGHECGEDHLVFFSSYAGDEAYARGFVEGCLERLDEEEDAAAEELRGLWEDPKVPAEEKRELVLEPLKAECEIREDEGEFWRL